jgi:membrane associated rhomboid family serine protease
VTDAERASQQVQTCYRHTDRKAGVRCQRCDRPICPSCMRQASVGFHCPECTKTGAQRVYTPRTLQRAPLITQVLIGINVAVFLLAMASPGGELLRSGGQVYADYSLFGPLVAAGEWYRLITSGFLHAGLIHLAFNMVALWSLGAMLEQAMGRLHYALTYFAALAAGSFGVIVLSPNSPTVGASGAVFGLMGAALVAYRARGIDPFRTGLGSVLMINLLITFTVRGISIGGHIGGLLGGMACGYVLEIVARRQRWPGWLGPTVVGVFGAACFAASIAIA